MLRSALSSFNKLDPRAQKTLGIARIFEAIESLRMDANNIQIINLAKFCENSKMEPRRARVHDVCADSCRRNDESIWLLAKL